MAFFPLFCLLSRTSGNCGENNDCLPACLACSRLSGLHIANSVSAAESRIKAFTGWLVSAATGSSVSNDWLEFECLTSFTAGPALLPSDSQPYICCPCFSDETLLSFFSPSADVLMMAPLKRLWKPSACDASPEYSLSLPVSGGLLEDVENAKDGSTAQGLRGSARCDQTCVQHLTRC